MKPNRLIITVYCEQHYNIRFYELAIIWSSFVTFLYIYCDCNCSL